MSPAFTPQSLEASAGGQRAPTADLARTAVGFWTCSLTPGCEGGPFSRHKSREWPGSHARLLCVRGAEQGL